jgi:hypothetical protein
MVRILLVFEFKQTNKKNDDDDEEEEESVALP